MTDLVTQGVIHSDLTPYASGYLSIDIITVGGQSLISYTAGSLSLDSGTSGAETFKGGSSSHIVLPSLANKTEFHLDT
jgi:hypothetical protein